MTDLSFEFFPPQTPAGRRKLLKTASQLAAVSANYFSVTYGAGGSTRDRTKDAVIGLADAGFDVAPHLSFGSDHSEDIAELLKTYQKAGIRRVVALRGDTPSGIGGRGEFRHARELVEFIREQTGDQFHIEVAAYPEVHPDAPDPESDIGFLKSKLDAGADGVLTQYFYNTDAYFDFVRRCHERGIDKPIVPGIMPITNYAGLVRFSDGCGAEIPRWIRLRLQSLEHNEEKLREFGEAVVSELCQRLLDGGAPGLHFYTLNHADPTLAVCRRLGFS